MTLATRALVALAITGVATSDDIANMLGIRSLQTTRKHLRKLVEEGLVERDGHSYRITHAGRAALPTA